jgi:hypothetical protein
MSDFARRVVVALVVLEQAAGGIAPLAGVAEIERAPPDSSTRLPLGSRISDETTAPAVSVSSSGSSRWPVVIQV